MCQERELSFSEPLLSRGLQREPSSSVLQSAKMVSSPWALSKAYLGSSRELHRCHRCSLTMCNLSADSVRAPVQSTGQVSAAEVVSAHVCQGQEEDYSRDDLSGAGSQDQDVPLSGAQGHEGCLQEVRSDRLWACESASGWTEVFVS